MALTYLALGDSYTIGEAVLLRESFPYQTVQLLRKNNIQVGAPEVVATTGWTTGELSAAIKEHLFLNTYDLVTLLIGVNDQYRGLPVDLYEQGFLLLLQQAILFAGNDASNVYVLSIPDYGVTPFAKDLGPQRISKEINDFNAVAQRLCEAHQVVFLNITESSRMAAADPGLLAADGLHPSAGAYQKWAALLAKTISEKR